MSNKNSNFPPNQLKNLEGDGFCTETYKNLLANTNITRRSTSKLTDEEVAERIEQYIQDCIDNDVRVGIEGACFRIGITRQTLINWTRGQNCSEYRKQLAINLKQFIVAFLEQSTLQGKLNPASSIFYLKNWANYVDKFDLANVTGEIESKTPDLEAIRAQYTRNDFDSESAAGLEPPEADF